MIVSGDGRVFLGADSGRNSVLDVNFAGSKTSGNLITYNNGTYTVTQSTSAISSGNPTFGIGGNNFGNAIQTLTPTANGILNVVGTSVGVGTTSPWRTLSVTGTVGFDGLTGTTGAGSICLDSNKQLVYNSGSDNCLSSLRSTKHDIQPLDLTALDMVKSLQPVSFVYNGDASSTVRYGFIAEDAAAVDQHFGTYDQSGNLSGVDDRSLLAIVVEAIQQIEQTVTGFADHFTSKEITFTRASGDEITVHKLCLDDVCVTRTQLQALLDGAGTSAGPTSPVAAPLPTVPDAPSIAPGDASTDSPSVSIASTSEEAAQ